MPNCDASRRLSLDAYIAASLYGIRGAGLCHRPAPYIAEKDGEQGESVCRWHIARYRKRGYTVSKKPKT
jgi:hypothetical protein